jgi:hypothetical protein
MTPVHMLTWNIRGRCTDEPAVPSCDEPGLFLKAHAGDVVLLVRPGHPGYRKDAP